MGFATEVKNVANSLLDVGWPTGRNPQSSWDGDHYFMRGTERPLSVSRTESYFLANLVALLDCSRVLEIGTGFGYSAAWLAYGLSLTSAPVEVITVDDDSEAVDAAETRSIRTSLWSRLGLSAHITQLVGHSPEVIDSIQGESFSLAFIDGDHHFEQPKLDFLAVEAKLKRHACVLFHDVQAKYTVSEAVRLAEDHGFIAIEIPTSCEPVACCTSEAIALTVRSALSLARRGVIMEIADGAGA